MGLYTIRDFQEGGILSEAYVPKSKYLKKAEELLDKIRKPYLVDDTKGMIGLLKINSQRLASVVKELYTDKDWKEFERCLEKQFGFETFSVNILRMSQINAFTYPVSLDMTRLASFDDVLDSSGLRYKESAKINGISFISDGLLFNSKMSSGQVLAIILHEIGHNFSQMAISFLAQYNAGRSLYGTTAMILSLFTKLDVYFGMDDKSNFEKFGALLSHLINTTDFGKRVTNLSKRNQLYKPVYLGFDTFASILAIKSDIKSVPEGAKKIVDSIKMIFHNKLLDYIKDNSKEYVKYIADNKKQVAVNHVMNYMGYMDESFADKFVAMNGYGVEFATAIKLMKTETLGYGINGLADKIPLVGQLFALEYIMGSFFGTIITGEPHPTDASRIMTQIDILEEELKRPDISPKTRAIIEKDIRDIKKETEKVDKLLRKEINLTSSSFRLYVLAWDEFITSVQPKKDIREKFMSLVNSNKKIMENLKKNAESDKTKKDSLLEKINNKLKLSK